MSITDAARRMAELAAHAADEKSASNIAVIDNRDGQCFVSMPRYASSKDDSGYKDICHPITKEFREELYEGIMKAYEQVQQIEENRLQLKISQVDQEKSQELKFNVKVTPFERD